jgi:multidrug efflux system membrane fusion protein
VTVAQALTRQVSDSAEFTGRLQAVDTVQVQPRVGGFVDSVHFQEGALVHKGDVLFQLDPRPYQAEVDRLSANQAQAKAALNLADHQSAPRRDAARPARRAQQEADSQDTAEQSARAQVAASTAALAAAPESGFHPGAFADRRPRQQYPHHRRQPGHQQRRADQRGHGESGLCLFRRGRTDLAQARSSARTRAGGHEARIEATMGLADESGYPHDGRLDFVDNQLHTDSGTMRLRAVFDNHDGLYTPGLYARVQLQLPISEYPEVVPPTWWCRELSRRQESQ